jgi:hypothetical protein
MAMTPTGVRPRKDATGGRDLDWWTTDAVVPYVCLVWVDNYRDTRHAEKKPETSRTCRSPLTS